MIDRRAQLSVWILACVVVSMLTHAIAEYSMLSLCGALVSVGVWIVTGGPRPVLPARWLVNLLVVGVVVFSGFRVITDGIGIELFAAFIVLMLMTKLLDRRRVRDMAQLLSLSLFLGVGSILTNNGLATSVGVLVLGGLLLSTTMRLQIAMAAERSPERVEAMGERESMMRRDLRALWSSVGVLTMMLSAVVFVLMPRGLGVSAFGSWGTPAIGYVSGFDDEITLGSGGLITPSPEPVLDLRVTNERGDPIGDVSTRFYLRGAVLTSYANGSWRRGEIGADGKTEIHTRSQEQTRRMSIVPEPSPSGRRVVQEITLRAVGSREATLFAVWNPVLFESDKPVLLIEEPDVRTLSVGRVSGRYAYTVESVDPRAPILESRVPQGYRRASGAAFAPEIGVYARNVMRSADIELSNGAVPDSQRLNALIRIAASFEDASFAYTLETLAAPAGRDPIEWFLFQSREGHCEYYASAMAAMCRTLGIDARVATGFVASEYNAGTDHYIVRASDAHAWVEAEIQPGVWETFDPTPTAEFERIHDPEVSFLATLRRVYDTVEFLWVRAVVAFDGGTRARLFGLPAADGAMIGEGLLRRFELARRIEPSNVAAAAAFGAGTSVVVYVAGSLVLARVRFATGFSAWLGATLRGLLLTLWASVPIRRRDAASLRDAVYREFVAMMGRAGYAKPRHEPLAAYVATCGVLDRLEEESGRTLSAIGGALYAWTYAGREPDAAAVLAALRDVRRLAGEFRKRGGAA